MRFIRIAFRYVRTFIILCVCPALLVGTLWVWWTTPRMGVNEIAFETQVCLPREKAAFTGAYIGSTGGGIYLFRGWRDQSQSYLEGELSNLRTIEFRRDQPVREFGYLDVCPNGEPPILPNWQRLGFSYSFGKTTVDGIEFRCVVIPLWFLTFAFALPPVMWISIVIMRYRRGHRCGFAVHLHENATGPS
jgi:hypothetical protein